MPTTVEVLAEALHSVGVDFIAGHPGGESVELMEAARTLGIRFILMKQEVAGAMMAATWGELSGIPGVCLSTRGPGATNMVNGIAYAALDRAPLLAITDRYSAPEHEIGLRQRIDHRAVYAPLVKWGTTVDPSVARSQIARAIQTATAPAPGPVHLDLPQSATTVQAKVPEDAPPLFPKRIASGADPATLDPIVRRIDAARKPILLARMGVLWDNASPQLTAFAERLGAPVLTTTKAKGTVPEDHPLAAGSLIGGLIERRLVSEADLIVTVGFDCVELQPKP